MKFKIKNKLDGGSIKDVRIKGSLTQKQLAEMMGITLAAVRRFEKGVKTPHLLKYIELCQIFRCDLWTKKYRVR